MQDHYWSSSAYCEDCDTAWPVKMVTDKYNESWVANLDELKCPDCGQECEEESNNCAREWDDDYDRDDEVNGD